MPEAHIVQLTALEFENVPALHDSQDDAPLSGACLPATDDQEEEE